jgi:hypothetical protein
MIGSKGERTKFYFDTFLKKIRNHHLSPGCQVRNPLKLCTFDEAHYALWSWQVSPFGLTNKWIGRGVFLVKIRILRGCHWILARLNKVWVTFLVSFDKARRALLAKVYNRVGMVSGANHWRKNSNLDLRYPTGHKKQYYTTAKRTEVHMIECEVNNWLYIYIISTILDHSLFTLQYVSHTNQHELSEISF